MKEVIITGTTKGTRRNDLVPQTKPGDNSRYLRHALDSYNLPPIDISDINQVQGRIDWYFDHCAADDMKPSVSGLCLALGINRDTLYSWSNGETRKSTHSEPVKRARAILEALWEDYMLNGKINPVAGIFLGKNNFGYTDKQELEIAPKNPMTDGLHTPEEIEEVYNELPTDE